MRSKCYAARREIKTGAESPQEPSWRVWRMQSFPGGGEDLPTGPTPKALRSYTGRVDVGL
jgi:hypothetical protein